MTLLKSGYFNFLIKVPDLFKYLYSFLHNFVLAIYLFHLNLLSFISFKEDFDKILFDHNEHRMMRNKIKKYQNKSQSLMYYIFSSKISFINS